MKPGSKALVTGGAGFLGSHVARHLTRRGHDVVVLDDLSGGFRCNVPQGVKFVQGSIVDADLVDELFREERFDHVFHLAAYASVGLSHYVRGFNYLQNLVGSANLISAAVNHNIQCFVYTSSASVYGPTAWPVSEDVLAAPQDPYGVAKLAVEQDLVAAHRQFGLPYVVFRPHNVYGERQNLADLYRNVVGIFMRQILAGEPCTLYGDGSQTRAFSHVDDVAPIIASSIHVPRASCQVFNIGSDTVCSVAELAEMLQQIMARQVGVRQLAPRQEAKHVLCDHSRLYEVFSCRETVPLAQGLARMVRWARRVFPEPPRPVSPFEFEQKLPASVRAQLAS